MTYARNSSDIVRFSPRKRKQALDFSDRALFPIW
jgi:hypothetical protein